MHHSRTRKLVDIEVVTFKRPLMRSAMVGCVHFLLERILFK